MSQCYFVCSFKYRYITQKIQFQHTVKEFQVLLFNINHLLAHGESVPSIAMYPKELTSHLFTQLNRQTVLFLTIQDRSFAQNWNVKQFYLTHRSDPIRCYHSGLKWIRKQWQWRAKEKINFKQLWIPLTIKESVFGGARGVIVNVVGNEHGETSSNPGRDWLHFT